MKSYYNPCTGQDIQADSLRNAMSRQKPHIRLHVRKGAYVRLAWSAYVYSNRRMYCVLGGSGKLIECSSPAKALRRAWQQSA